MLILLYVHYVVGVFSLFMEVLLLIIIMRFTPKAQRVYASLLLQGCIFELTSAITNALTMERNLPIPGTTIFASMGVCGMIDRNSCYILHTIAVSAYVSAQWIVLFQLIFRYNLLSDRKSWRVQLWFIPMGIMTAGLQLNVFLNRTPHEILERLVNETFPEIVDDGYPFNGHSTFSLPVSVVNFFYVFSLVAIWSGIYLFRRKVFAILNSNSCAISDKSKVLHKAVVKRVTIHALLSVLVLCPFTSYFIGQFIIIKEENFLDSCFLFLQLQCTINPSVTLYLVPEYRKSLPRAFGPLLKVDISTVKVEQIKCLRFFDWNQIAPLKRFSMATSLVLVQLLFVVVVNAVDWCPEGNSQFSQADREVILNAHNSLRSRIALGTMTAGGKAVPAAANMQKMEWDCTLEQEAQKYSESTNCVSKHSEKHDGQGENLFWTAQTEEPYTSAEIAGQASPDWESEYNACTFISNIYDNDKNDNECAIGHASQMAWATSTRIGCGVQTHCEMDNEGYFPAGNLNGEIYTTGPACTQCPEGTTCDTATGLCVEGEGNTITETGKTRAERN